MSCGLSEGLIEMIETIWNLNKNAMRPLSFFITLRRILVKRIGYNHLKPFRKYHIDVFKK